MIASTNTENASGQVTGYASTAGDAADHAFLWNGTEMVDLGTLGGTFSQGAAINASGQLTGFAYATGNAGHAFFWNGTEMVDLGTLGGTFSSGSAINDSGQVS